MKGASTLRRPLQLLIPTEVTSSSKDEKIDSSKKDKETSKKELNPEVKEFVSNRVRREAAVIACYGIVQVPKGPWFCRKCESQERIARVKCELCPMKEGALKRTDTGGWAHVLCALYIPEVRFGNVATMEPIILSSVPHEKFQKTCYLCEEHGRESKTSTGACMQCNKVACRQSFHVTCAQAAKLLCEEQQGVSANTVKYVGYCSYHWNKKISKFMDQAIQALGDHKGKGVVIPRANERARSKAEGRSVHKPDITKRPSVIGTTKSSDALSPTSLTKQKNRKLSKSADTLPEPLSGSDSPSLLASQQLMKTQKITSPLNTPSVRDQLSGYTNAVSTQFPFQHSLGFQKPDTPSYVETVSNGVPEPVVHKLPTTGALTQPKENWKSPPAPPSAKKSDKGDDSSTKAAAGSETKSMNKPGSVAKKRKNNKAGGACEDGKKRQKTANSGHEKKNLTAQLSAVGNGKMPVLPPSPFVSKPSSFIREIEIPTKLDDFLEFQWKQGVEFLSHQQGYLDVASLLSCLHQLKHENVKLESRLTELIKRRDHLLLVNSRLSKSSNNTFNSPSLPSLSQASKRRDMISPTNVLESSRNSSVEKNKSQESTPFEFDVPAKDRSEQTAKQPDPKAQLQPKEQFVAKKEQQQRQRTHPDALQAGKESSQPPLEKKSPIKVDTPPIVEERLREATSSPSRATKTTVEGKLAASSLSSVTAERTPSRQSPKSRKSPQGSASKKMKSQEQLMQQEHQKLLQQQQQQMKQQKIELNRQKFQQPHLLPLQQGNQQFNQHFAHQNSKLAFFKLPGYNGAEQHAMHQSKQSQMNGSPQQYNSQSLPRQFPNFVPYIDHNVRMQGYVPVYPVENTLNKVIEEKMDSSSTMQDKSERRN